jgi:hypothetical protein
MNVYIVTSGEYSDYKIEGVFSTKEKADAFAAKVTECTGGADVNEWPLDAQGELTVRRTFHASIKLDDGEIKEWTSAELVSTNARSLKDRAGYFNNTATASSAVSAEHARKLVIEVRQKFLREKAIQDREHEEQVKSSKKDVAEYIARGGH